MSVEQLPPVKTPEPTPDPFVLDWLGPGWDWSGPGPAAPAKAIVAVAATGVVAAVSVPLGRVGIGWALTGLAMVLGLRWVATDRKPDPDSRIGRMVWTTIAVALLAVGAVRDAGWLFVLCALASVVAGAFAIIGPRTVTSAIGSLPVQAIAIVLALSWAARGILGLRTRRTGSARLGLILAVSVALLVVFGSLFIAADAAFAELAGAVIPAASTLFRGAFLFCAGGAIMLGAAYLVLAPPVFKPGTSERATVQRLEWTVPLIVLDLLFTVFVAVQLTVLFGGSRHVLRTAGLTFAEYARRGFWQLLVVTVLALAVLAIAGRWAPRTTAAERAWVRALLGTLAVLSLVIVTSAVYRMSLYMQAYGFTRLRVLVITAELALGLVFILVLAAGVRLRGPWLPQAVVAIGVVMLLGLAILNPDRFVADRDIDRYQHGARLDIPYLRHLSTDAVPALYRLPEGPRNCVLPDVRRRLGNSDGWQAWNLGRAQARRAIDAEPPTGPCYGIG